MTILYAYLYSLFWIGLYLLPIGIAILLLLDLSRFLARRIVRPSGLGQRHEVVRVTMTLLGIMANLVWCAVLFGICGFNHGDLASDWVECVPWIAVMALPAGLASVGLRKGPALIGLAAGLSLPLAFISLAGAGLPMLVPGTLFAIAAWTCDTPVRHASLQ